ncbi:MAG: tetratricopeptide repeat protein [Chloroflexi bacterium]|nr:tetratricopeptide repeat protein [Chloroflexota bacterium]
MKKRRQRKKSTFRSKRPSHKIRDAIEEAMELHEEGNSGEAQAILIDLVNRHPRSKPALYTLLEVCNNQQDWATFARYGEQMLVLERGPARADSLNNLIVAYTNLIFPALAWQRGRELVSQYPDYPDIEKIKALIVDFRQLLLENGEVLFAETTAVSLSPEEQLDVMVTHDRIRLYTESGQAKKGIETAETLLKKVPDFIPALNNLSLSHFVDGDTGQAIETAQQVLDQQPNNFYALSNIIRYQFLSAQFDTAQQSAARLKQINNDNPDLRVKQAEALSFLGDDEGVRQAYLLAKEEHDDLPPLLLHLAAAAHFRLGNEKKAWQLWRQIEKTHPGFKLAQANLEDQFSAAGQRDAPWYWTFPYWLSADFHRTLEQFILKITRITNEQTIEKEVHALLDKHPYLPQLCPHILDRGDRHVREFILNFIRMTKTVELTNILYDFCTSAIGADDLRLEALQLIQENRPDLLPSDGMVPMWIKGKQKELFTIGFEIYDEPNPPLDLDEEILEKHDDAFELLLDEEYDEAEILLQEIITAAPDFAAVYNHLAVAYERQDRREESEALILEIRERFPDYLFGRVAQARLYLREDKVKEARALVQPLLRQERLHISEFRSLAEVHIEIALADGLQEGALSWLNMWEQIDEDNPDIEMWRMRIEGPQKVMQGLRKLLGKSME